MSEKLNQMIDALRAQVNTVGTDRIAARSAIENIQATCLGDGRTPTEDEARQVREAQARVVDLDAKRSEVESRLNELVAERDNADAVARFVKDQGLAGAGTASIHVEEKRTYRSHGEHSFFADVWQMQQNPASSATERVNRHLTEVRVNGELTQRAQSTGGANGLVIPQYLIDQYALVARAGRPTANLMQHLELPDSGMSIVIPRGTTGASAASQSTENSGLSSTDEVWASLTVPIVTIAGQQDVSRQLLERGGAQIDQIVYSDIAAAYAAELDRQVVAGSGSSNQMLGILSTAGINQASAFTAAATVSTFYTKLAGQLNAVETTRFLAPTGIVMHPRRWNWLVSQLDSSTRPLVVPNSAGPFNAIGTTNAPVDAPSARVVGSILGLPVYTDANIPTAVGTGPEDQVLVLREQDCLLWEDGDGMPTQIRYDQTLGGQLTTKLVGFGYAAFTAGRYPAAVGVVGGNAGTAGFGLIAPTF